MCSASVEIGEATDTFQYNITLKDEQEFSVWLHIPFACSFKYIIKMFIKPFKIKSNTQIKTTERKKIRGRIENSFEISDDDLNKLFPNKSILNQLKLITNSNDQVTVYSCDRRPMFFEFNLEDLHSDKIILAPTVYSLWIVPDLVPAFTTHPSVFPRLANGADLMLPGVIKQGSGYNSYGSFPKNTIVAVNLSSNSSAVGVGTLAKSSADLFMSGNAGICVNILHVFGDRLWNIEPSVCLQVPISESVIKAPTIGDFPSLVESMIPMRSKDAEDKVDTKCNDDFQTVVRSGLEKLSIEKNENDVVKSESQKPSDDRLKQVFLIAIKAMGKKPPIPLLTSNFHRCHMLNIDNDIDIKKTSYKKLSKFLQDMASQNYITVKEEPKGVEKIVSINVHHPDIENVIIDVSKSGQNETKSTTEGLFVTEMKELYTVTNETIRFFNLFDVKLGEGIESVKVKKCLKEYVCSNKLQDAANIRHIHIDQTLQQVCSLNENQKILMFDDLLSLIINKMDHSYAMRNRNELKTSGKQNTIKMSLATRCGNKQVTLVDHLEMFGIRLIEFAQVCKIGVASSTSIIRPNCPGNGNKGQILIQGNQIRFVHNLLTTTYKIPSQFITGMELAKKEKKAKKK